jgi:hypothetical protein
LKSNKYGWHYCISVAIHFTINVYVVKSIRLIPTD